MKFINQIHDALKYTLKDWKAIVLLGIIICISDTSREFHVENIYLSLLVFIISIGILLFEEGYRFKIVSETLNGNNYPPIIENVYELIKEGFYEVVTLYAYFIVYLIFYDIYALFKGNIVIGIILFSLSQMVILSFFGAPIYKALNDGKFKSAFNIYGILKLYSKMGLYQTIFMLIVSIISQNIIISSVLDMGVLQTHHLLEFLLNFFLAPILLLFETRLISVCGKEAISNQN